MSGSWKSGIFGGKKVHTIKNTVRRLRITRGKIGEAGWRSGFLKSKNSTKYASPADIKKIAIFTQSGVVPNAPLRV